jgi:energy-coupling factor transporter ATP-binding protein EcfA2
MSVKSEKLGLSRDIEGFKWQKVVAVVGALGSGKSEWLLNLANAFLAHDENVTVADVDIINPYFCIREVSALLKKMGLSVILPFRGTQWSDLPSISPEVDRAFDAPGKLLIDIGGDPRGAMALTQFAPRMEQAGYSLVAVVNAFRPQTSTVEGIEAMIRSIERVSGLQVSAIISNSHYMSETTVDDVVEGYGIARTAAEKMDLPVIFVGVPESAMDEAERRFEGERVSLWPVSRYILLPWERGGM